MSTQIVWNGTQEESFALVNAIARNCACEFGAMGVRVSTCAPHRMLTEDQRALNGLLFVRRVVDRLMREEFS
jgi:NAD(P)-dependent dehydrogenase (short-subunit alcohol dehydrogenase family)